MQSVNIDFPAPSASSLNSIAAVVVTNNRLSLLQQCLAAILAQTRRPDEIIVINNGSTDGTAAWLAQQTDFTVIEQVNSGSSGGQHAGIRAAYRKGYDWIWCMDDDTICEPDALQEMVNAPYFKREDTGFLASVPYWSDGKPHFMFGLYPTAAAEWADSVVTDLCIPVQMWSFVSVMFSRRAVARVGLPVHSFFLIVDDYEYTHRVTLSFRGYCALKSRVVHKTKAGAGSSNLRDPGTAMKECYRIRNEIAWTRSRSDIGRWGKFTSISTVWMVYTRLVLRGEGPPRLLWWALKGMFFRYRIDAA